MIIAGFAHADDRSTKQMFESGVESLQVGDYFEAFKSLYTFKILEKERLAKPENSDLRQQLDADINEAEKEVRKSLSVCRNKLCMNGTAVYVPRFEGELHNPPLGLRFLEDQIKLEGLRNEGLKLQLQLNQQQAE